MNPRLICILFVLLLSSTTYAGDFYCPPQSTVTYHEQDFESGSTGWTTEGLNDSDVTWAINGSESNSGNYSVHAEALPYASDQTLISPVIAMPITQEPLSLHFWHRYIFEAENNEIDGGILEVSIDGSAFIQVFGVYFLANGYNGQLQITDNVLSEYFAWVNHQPEWTESVVDLSPFINAQTLQFRFRLGTDISIGTEGWYIDDFAIKSCFELDQIYTDGFDG